MQSAVCSNSDKEVESCLVGSVDTETQSGRPGRDFQKPVPMAEAVEMHNQGVSELEWAARSTYLRKGKKKVSECF